MLDARRPARSLDLPNTGCLYGRGLAERIGGAAAASRVVKNAKQSTLESLHELLVVRYRRHEPIAVS